ncbi:hypothetical protein [Deinococcus soli (ex Cha et al. 2016)]|uniref:Uncharacterized protein n=2 Tax=Deinococcus soli (ex Cha et al. 2016) TaxID=1309411 RepID=A0AAE3XD76_9DEIO|nr:hypothetical protein [Deinococcus soli (ex Cha et al. 2016)]MDR6218789.1 hypothetical protein [Deinococcus soli (ex Cha et al. 2016)]MDR6328586.1 hypothetical protein [Deinococcus soli (ex Cha et al. 2016)]MDR6751927.1 hypothetical protein [Deinococcus soli (ex Cha et al. 2016)]
MTSRSRRATLAILALPLLLAACTTAAPAPTTTPAELTGTRRAVQDVIPAAERARRAQLQRATTADIRRLEIYPKTYLTTQPGPAAYYLKGYAADGTDLGVIDPNLITVTAQPGATLTSAARDQSVLDVTPDGTTRLTTFTVTLKDRPDVTTHGSVELVTLQPDVTEIPDTSVLFPKANLDAAVLTPDVLAAATAPVTADEMRAAIESLSDTVPEIPVVLRGVTVTPGDKVALLGLTGQYGTITRVTAQHDGVSVVIITPDLPDAFFAVYERNPLNSSSVWDAGQTDQAGPSGALTAQAATASPCKSEVPGLDYQPSYDGPKLSTFGMDDGLKLSTKIENTFTFGANIEASFTCKWNPEDVGTIPVPGALGAFMSVKWGFGAELTGTATMDGTALELGNTLTFDMPVIPSGSPTLNAENSLSLGGTPDLLNVDGPAASAKVTLTAFPHIRITLLPGNATATRMISVFAKTVNATNLGKVLNPKRLGYIKLLAGPEAEASAAAYSMRTVFEDKDATPGLALKTDARVDAEAGGWFFTKLSATRFGSQIPTSGTLLTVPISKYTSASPTLNEPVITDQPTTGNAQVTLNWKEADAGIQRVQLAADPANSLHGDVLSPQGGAVSYLPSECTGQNRLSAKVLAVAPIRVNNRPFGLGLPFVTDKTVSVCRTGIQVTARVGNSSSGSTYAGGRVLLSATLSNASPEATQAGVTWTAPQGEIKKDPTDNQWYWTAPVVPTSNLIVLTARSVYDTSKSGTVSMSVSRLNVNATVAGGYSSTSTSSGGRVALNATITNASEDAKQQGVTWKTTYGTLEQDTAGTWFWRSPIAPDGTIATVTATSVADPSRSDSVTISTSKLNVSATVGGGYNNTSTYSGGRVALNATISNTSQAGKDAGVTWKTTYGTLEQDTTGAWFWRSPIAPDGTIATVTATSVADPSRSGSATISTSKLNVSATVGGGYNNTSTYSGGRVPLNASISNTSQAGKDAGVTWTADYGAIEQDTSSGTWYWVAPLAPDRTYAHVTATSVADPSRSSSATISVSKLNVRATAGSYSSTSTYAGGRVPLNASVSNTSQAGKDAGVTWTVDYGRLEQDLLSSTWYWIAPLANADGAKATVRATSVADPSRSGTATVSVTPLSIKATLGSGSTTATVVAGTTVRVNVTFTNASADARAMGVTPSATDGTFTTDAAGVVSWTAPAVTATTTFTLTLVSNADPARSSSVTVTVTPRTP